jgi:hypothetical protein
MIGLGDRVRDRISGLEGIVIGITDWLYQCRRPIVQPTTLTDGKPTDSLSFDEPQLELLEKAAFKVQVEEVAEPSPKTGGPRATPTRRSDPNRR